MAGFSSSVSTAATGTTGGGNVFTAAPIFGNAANSISPYGDASKASGGISTTLGASGSGWVVWLVGGLAAVAVVVGLVFAFRRKKT